MQLVMAARTGEINCFINMQPYISFVIYIPAFVSYSLHEKWNLLQHARYVVHDGTSSPLICLVKYFFH